MINVYLTDTIVIKKITYDKWGESSETTETVKARIEYKTRLIRNFAGEQVVSSARIMLKNRILSHADKINFDDADHSILSIGKEKDFSNQYLMVDVA